MTESLRQLSVVLTVILNTIVLITAVLKISSVVYSLKQSIIEVRNHLDKEVTEVTHSVKILEVELQNIENKLDAQHAGNEKSREIISQSLLAEIKELETDLKIVRAHVRDLENFTQKNNPEFHVRS